MLSLLIACADPSAYLLTSDGDWAPISRLPVGADASGAPITLDEANLAYQREFSGALDAQQALLADEVLWVRFEGILYSSLGHVLDFSGGLSWAWMTLDDDGQLALFSVPPDRGVVQWFSLEDDALTLVDQVSSPEGGLVHAVIADGEPLLWFQREDGPRAWREEGLVPVESSLGLGPAVRGGGGLLWNQGDGEVRSSSGCVVPLQTFDDGSAAFQSTPEGVVVWFISERARPMRMALDSACEEDTRQLGDAIPLTGSSEAYSFGTQAMLLVEPDAQALRYRFKGPHTAYVDDYWTEGP